MFYFMNIFCGTDIVEIDRIKQIIEETDNLFTERVFTKNEIEYCEGRRLAKYQHYAARFAAKEAIFKAISKKLKSKYSVVWQNMEITNDENGRPVVHFIDCKIEELEGIDISISHCKKYATATAIAMMK